jgi:hypothetical protein
MRAFPNFRSEGMELRDYFAAKAMVGQMWSDNYEEDAKNCYKIADAMMEARKVPDSKPTREFTADETLRGRG